MKMTPVIPLLVLAALAATSSYAQRDTRNLAVSTLAELDGRRPLTGETVWVGGITAVGDWGEPRAFYYDSTSSAAVNDVVRAAAGGVGRYIHKWNGDVRTFNVLPDDASKAAANGAGIERAVAYAKTQRKAVYFPSTGLGGIYYTDRTIIATNDVNNRPLILGLHGDGIGRSRILHTGFNQSVVKIRGLGCLLRGLTIGYLNIQGSTNTSAACVEFPGFNSMFDIADVQVVNGYIGFRATADESGYAMFSSSFRNVTAENCDQGFDMPTGSGNYYYNIYISAYGLPSATRAFIDRSGISRYEQFNVEHSNYRSIPLIFQGSGASIGRLHVEGIHLYNSEPIMAIQQAIVNVDQLTIINSYFNGAAISAITFSGTNAIATVNDLGDAISGGHGIAVGDTMYINGATDPLYNGAKSVLAVTTTNFTYGMSGTPAANAVVDYAGGYDYLSANRGTASSALSSLLDTSIYENPKLKINALKIRDNRIINSAAANRNGLLLVNELNGRLASVDIDSIDTGAPSDPMAGRQLAAVPIVGVSATGGIATVYTRTPHLFSTNELAYFQANTAGIRTSTNWTVLTVPNQWTFTVAISTATTIPLTREIGGGVCVPVVTAITNISRSNNVATAICSGNHYLKELYKLGIYNISGTNNLNNTAAVALNILTTNAFTYRSVGADVASSTENQGVVTVYDAGVSEFLVTSTHLGLKNAGHLFQQTTCLSSNVIAGGSYDLTTNTINGARLGDSIVLNLLDSANWNADLQVSGVVLANNNIVITRRNVSTNSITNLAGIWLAHLKRN